MVYTRFGVLYQGGVFFLTTSRWNFCECFRVGFDVEVTSPSSNGELPSRKRLWSRAQIITLAVAETAEYGKWNQLDTPIEFYRFRHSEKYELGITLLAEAVLCTGCSTEVSPYIGQGQEVWTINNNDKNGLQQARPVAKPWIFTHNLQFSALALYAFDFSRTALALINCS